MKKSSLITLFVFVAVAVAIIILGAKYFIVPEYKPGQSTDKKQEVVTSAPAETSADENKTIQAISETSEQIKTAAPEAELIELNSKGSENIRIETMSPIEYTVPEEANANYQKASMLGVSEPLWTYQDAEGNIQLRTYGTRWKRINNVNQEKQEGYFAVEIKNHSDGKTYIEITSSEPVDPNEEKFATPERTEQEETALDSNKYYVISNNIYACITKTGAKFYRTFASVNGHVYLYNCDAGGNINPGSVPVAVDEEIHNLMPYSEEYASENALVNYPGRYNQTKNVLTIEP